MVMNGLIDLYVARHDGYTDSSYRDNRHESIMFGKARLSNELETRRD